MSGYHMIQGH